MCPKGPVGSGIRRCEGATSLSGKTQAARIRDAVRGLVEKLLEREGYELLETEYVMDRGRPILRLYVDTIPPSTEGRGVSVEDCTHVSRWVSDVLDVEDVVPGEYNLEVSSPGLFRPLTKAAHFERAVGERIKVKTYEKQDGRRVFTGILEARDEDRLVVRVDDGQTFEIPLGSVAKANLEPHLDL